MSHPHRPAWWHEIALIAATYGIYTLTRNTLPAHLARARGNADDVYRLERRLHLDIELSVNQFLADHSRHWLAVIANYTYSLSHFAVTMAVLIWLYVARPHAYPGARTVLLLTTLLGLLGFWLYPLAPPRIFPDLGFVDTVVRDHTWGSWGTGTVTRISNQYAAMPSVHIAWSVWVAATVALCARRRWLRAAVWLYPALVFFVIIGTANHWTLDVAGGVAAVAIAASLWVTVQWAGRRRGLAGRGRRRTTGRSALARHRAGDQPRLHT
jgi:hypothetical protein